MVTKPGSDPPPPARRGPTGKRRRPVQEPPALWWAVFAALGVLAVYWWSWRVVLFALALWCLYEVALIPHRCRVNPNGGKPCELKVRGRAFGCGRPHQAIKNDAFWALAGRQSNPFRRQPEADPTRVTGEIVWSPAKRGRLNPADRRVLLLAAAGTLVAIAGMAYGLAA